MSLRELEGIDSRIQSARRQLLTLSSGLVQSGNSYAAGVIADIVERDLDEAARCAEYLRSVS